MIQIPSWCLEVMTQRGWWKHVIHSLAERMRRSEWTDLPTWLRSQSRQDVLLAMIAQPPIKTLPNWLPAILTEKGLTEHPVWQAVLCRSLRIKSTTSHDFPSWCLILAVKSFPMQLLPKWLRFHKMTLLQVGSLRIYT